MIYHTEPLTRSRGWKPIVLDQMKWRWEEDQPADTTAMELLQNIGMVGWEDMLLKVLWGGSIRSTSGRRKGIGAVGSCATYVVKSNGNKRIPEALASRSDRQEH